MIRYSDIKMDKRGYHDYQNWGCTSIIVHIFIPLDSCTFIFYKEKLENNFDAKIAC